jgi:agmatinase
MTDSPTPPARTFAGLPDATISSLDGAKIAILGADHGSPYQPGVASHAAGGAAAIRAGSQLFAKQLSQFDFDIAGALRSGPDDRRIVDCGDLLLDRADSAANRAAIEAATRAALDAGAVPFVLGGDDSVPIPVFSAYEGRGPLTMVQVDAHVDWGDVIQGNPYGYGSPMRRAAEMSWFTGMVQVGVRGLGSGTSDQHDDARAWGSRIVTMEDIERSGIDAALNAEPAGGDCFLSIDLDGLDPTCMPAVEMPTPGGLSYRDALRLVRGIAQRRRIAGVAIVEFVPARDPHGLAAITAARLALSLMGLIAGQPPRDIV